MQVVDKKPNGVIPASNGSVRDKGIIVMAMIVMVTTMMIVITTMIMVSTTMMIVIVRKRSHMA